MAAKLEVFAKFKDGFTSGIKKATSSFKRFGTRVKGAFSGARKAIFSVRTAMLGLAAIAGGAIFGLLITSTANAADEIGKLSLRLGTSTEFLSEMRFASERAGVAASEMDLSFQRAIRRLGDIARTGRGEAAPAIEELGGGLLEAVKRGESFEKLLPVIADQLNKVADPAKKLSIAFQLFGLSGAKLIPLLKEGSSGIKALRDEAEELGISLGQRLTNDAAAFNDELTRLKASFDGIRFQAFGALLPIFEAITAEVRTFLVDFRPKLKTFFADIIASIRTGLPVLIKAFRTFGENAVLAFAKIKEAVISLLTSVARLQLLLDNPKLFLTVQLAGAKEAADGVKGLTVNVDESNESLESFLGLLARVEQNLRAVATAQPGDEGFVGPLEFVDPTDVLKSIGSSLSSAKDEAGSLLGKLMSIAGVQPSLAAGVQAFGAAAAEAFDDAAAAAEAFRKEQKRIKLELERLEDGAAGAGSALKQIFIETSDFNIARDAVLSLKDGLTSGIGGALVGIITQTKSAKEAFEDLGRSILRTIAQIVTQAAIAAAINATLKAITPGGGATLLSLAHGGVVSGPKSGFLIEAHGTEAVIPLKNGSVPVQVSAPAGGGGNTINFNINAIDAKSFDDRWKEGLLNNMDGVGDVQVQQFQSRPSIRDAMA